VLLGGIASSANGQAKRPDILVIVADDPPGDSLTSEGPRFREHVTAGAAVDSMGGLLDLGE